MYARLTFIRLTKPRFSPFHLVSFAQQVPVFSKYFTPYALHKKIPNFQIVMLCVALRQTGGLFFRQLGNNYKQEGTFALC